jgi:hypothetical protein
VSTEPEHTSVGVGIDALKVLCIVADSRFSSNEARIRIGGTDRMPFDDLKLNCEVACDQVMAFSFVASAVPEINFATGPSLKLRFKSGGIGDPDRRLDDWAHPQYEGETEKFDGRVDRDGSWYTATVFTLEVSTDGRWLPDDAVKTVRNVPGVSPAVQRLSSYSVLFSVVEPDDAKARAIALAAAKALKLYVPADVTIADSNPAAKSNPVYNQPHLPRPARQDADDAAASRAEEPPL